MLGIGGEQIDVGEAALRNRIVWAVARGNMISSGCPPLVLWHLAHELLLMQQTRRTLQEEEQRLLRDIHGALAYPVNALFFEDLALVSEVSRRSLLAAGKTAVSSSSAPFLNDLCIAAMCKIGLITQGTALGLARLDRNIARLHV